MRSLVVMAGHAVVSASISAVLTTALREVVIDPSAGPHGEPKWSRVIRRGLAKGCDVVIQATNLCLETVDRLWKGQNCPCTVPPAALTNAEDLPLWLRLVQDPSQTMGDGQPQ